MQQNIHSSHVHKERSPGMITGWATKGGLGKFKKTEIISSIFSDHNTMRLEINYKREKAGENDLVNEL